MKKREELEGYTWRKCKAIGSLPKECPYKRIEELNILNSFKGHSLGIFIGTLTGDTYESAFKKDKENGNTDILEKLIKSNAVIEKVRTVCDRGTGQITNKTFYYIVYEILDHSSKMETPQYQNIDFCCNTSHEIKYEVLFTDSECEGSCRYITLEYRTEGAFAMPLFDMFNHLEDSLEEYISNHKDEFVGEDGGKAMKFYDQIGEHWDYEYTNVSQLLNKVASIRLIEMKTTIKD